MSYGVQKLSFILIMMLIITLQIIRGVGYVDPAYGSSRAEQLANHDFRWVYVSGRGYLKGKNPQEPETFKNLWVSELNQSKPDCPLGYPPTLAIISIPTAMAGWNHAHYVYDTLNVLSYLLILYILYRLVAEFIPSASVIKRFSAVALGALCSAISANLYTGQSATIATLGVVGIIYFCLKDKLWIAALFMILASIKPHLCILVFIWLSIWKPQFFIRSCMVLGLFVVTTLVIAWNPHPIDSMLESIRQVDSHPFFQPGNLNGLYQLLDNKMMTSVLPIFSIILMAFISFKYRNQDPIKLIIFALLLTLTLMPLHAYDLCLSVILVVTLFSLSMKIIYLPAFILCLRPNAIVTLTNHASLGPQYVSYVQWIMLAIVLIYFTYTQLYTTTNLRPLARVA